MKNYRILKSIRDSGYEIGYHSEIVDQAVIWDENAEECLRRDIDVLNRMLDIEIKGIASHGGMTGLNNLDFWQEGNHQNLGYFMKLTTNQTHLIYLNLPYTLVIPNGIDGSVMTKASY